MFEAAEEEGSFLGVGLERVLEERGFSGKVPRSSRETADEGVAVAEVVVEE